MAAAALMNEARKELVAASKTAAQKKGAATSMTHAPKIWGASPAAHTIWTVAATSPKKGASASTTLVLDTRKGVEAAKDLMFEMGRPGSLEQWS